MKRKGACVVSTIGILLSGALAAQEQPNTPPASLAKDDAGAATVQEAPQSDVPPDEPMVCLAESNSVKEVEARYQPLLQAAGERGAALNREAEETELLKVSLVWKDEKISFDLPTVNMRRNNMSLHLPQVSMRTQRMSFDILETYMGTTKCGQYPEFSCSGWKCRTSWTDIKCDLPQTRRKRVDMSMDIPETTWARTDFSMDLPDLTTARQEWKFRIPQRLDVDTIFEQQKDIERKGQELKSETEAIVQVMQKEVAEKANALLQCHRKDLLAKQQDALTQFDLATAQIERSIQAIVSQGGDPRNLIGENGKIDLFAIRDDVLAKRAKADDDFKKAIAALDHSEKKGLDETQTLATAQAAH